MITYFFADWCVPCHEFRPVVNEIANDLGIDVEYVDIETTEGLERGLSYDVISIPTLVYNGRKQVGVVSEPKLREWLTKD